MIHWTETAWLRYDKCCITVLKKVVLSFEYSNETRGVITENKTARKRRFSFSGGKLLKPQL